MYTTMVDHESFGGIKHPSNLYSQDRGAKLGLSEVPCVAVC